MKTTKYDRYLRRQFTYIVDIKNSSSTRGRGIYCGGFENPNQTNTIDFIEISTLGNAQNFDSGIAQDTWKIIGVFFNKAGNQIGARVDGANAFTPVNDYDNSLTPNLDLRIFRNRSSERMSGKLAEFFTVADAPHFITFSPHDLGCFNAS